MKNNALERITPREKDFNQWYTDVVKQSGLIQYGLVKGTVAFSPYATKIWNKIKKFLNEEFEKVGVEEVMLPTLFPLSLLEKEKENIEGFAPELFKITEIQGSKINDPLVLRPTSEIPFSNYFKGSINTYKDLPVKLNQWANVFRMENNTRPFLRNSEFIWQEGHTSHSSSDESDLFAKKILNIYLDLIENVLLIPTISGKKPESEKFPAAKTTYTIEAMMQNGYALQSATSHNLIDNFSKVYDVKFQDKDNKFKNVFQSSWGLTTRIIGGMIMAHSDDNGLVLPPSIAPTCVSIIEISANKNPNVELTSNKISKEISKFTTVAIDDRNLSFGKKAADSEIKGTPIRIEVGPRGIAENKVTVFRRDTLTKEDIDVNDVSKYVKNLLEKISKNIAEKSRKSFNQSILTANNFKEFSNIFEKGNKFVKTNFLTNIEVEKELKEKFGVTPRVVLDEKPNSNCFYSNKIADSVIIWARAY
ncbi:MAG: proline--tRNA ligase [Mycoplasmataceae bacterium]|nr:proline--tRNA ligase [Mycoplasmataceae bacterium]